MRLNEEPNQPDPTALAFQKIVDKFEDALEEGVEIIREVSDEEWVDMAADEASGYLGDVLNRLREVGDALAETERDLLEIKSLFHEIRQIGISDQYKPF